MCNKRRGPWDKKGKPQDLYIFTLAASSLTESSLSNAKPQLRPQRRFTLFNCSESLAQEVLPGNSTENGQGKETHRVQLQIAQLPPAHFLRSGSALAGNRTGTRSHVS